ncbi:MAG: DUF2784 domain-containing protein [Ilumatobacter sp.]|nr:DUF2784 domain-containing protein [Ilumatobacter sp.]
MGWRLAADAVMTFHLAFVLFVVVGGFLAWRWRRVASAHLPIAIYGVLIEVIGFTCPLTPLEKMLRRRAGSGGYDGGFVEHYVVPVLYPGAFTAATKALVAALLVTITAIAYAGIWIRSRPTPAPAR